MSTFLGYPTTAAFLAECEAVRHRATVTYAAIDTPDRLHARQRDAHAAGAHVMPWETR